MALSIGRHRARAVGCRPGPKCEKSPCRFAQGGPANQMAIAASEPEVNTDPLSHARLPLIRIAFVVWVRRLPEHEEDCLRDIRGDI